MLNPEPAHQVQSNAAAPEIRPVGGLRHWGGLCLLGVIRCAKWLIKSLLVLYFLFAILFLALRYAVLPNVDRFKPEIEQMTGQLIGRQVQIEQIHASIDGISPRLTLNNLVIRNQAGEPALAVPQVRATLSWLSLLVADLHFAQLEIEQPKIEIQRDTQGRLLIAGFVIDTQKKGDGKDLDWLLSQRHIQIHHGALNWVDQLKQIPDIALSDIDFSLNNQWRHHRFALKATPPVHLSAPLDIRGDFQHPVFTKKISDFATWTGELYTNLQNADLGAIRTYVQYPIDLKSGKGALQTWTTMDKGRIAEFTADVRLNDVVGRFRPDLPLLDMEKVSGRVVASEKISLGRQYFPFLTVFQGQTGHAIALIDFAMQTREGVSLPATTIRENFYPAEKGKPEKVELYAKLLDLQTLANFAEHLPLPDDQRRMLMDFAPKGQLKEFSASWQGSFPEVSAYQVSGQFVNLSMNPLAPQLARPKTANKPARAALPAIPGFENLSGSLDANDRGGRFQIESSNLTLQSPGYLLDPVLPFQKLNMAARWEFLPQDKLALEIDNMEFEQDGTRGALSGRHIVSLQSKPGEGAGEIDLKGNLTGFDLKQIKRYLPTSMEEDLRVFLVTALLDGHLNDVQFLIKGDLNHFPFGGKEVKPGVKGDFHVKGNIVDGKLNFSPDNFREDGKTPAWPIIEHINGTIEFDRAKLELHSDSASTMGLALNKVKAVIPDLYGPDAILDVNGVISGGMQSMVQYVNVSPVDRLVGHFLQEARATGNASMNLGLHLPLKHVTDTKVNGVLQFMNDETKLQSDIPLISNLVGKLEFNERDINLNGVKANILGGAAVATGGTQKDGTIKIKVEGLATADGIHKHFSSPKAEKYVNRVTGSTRYVTQVNIKKQKVELLIDSSLQDLALNFPAPLFKTSSEIMPLHLELLPVTGSDPNMLYEDLKINLGSAVAARYHRQKSSEKNAAWRMTRGGIGVNVAVPEPESGLYANVDYKSLNVDDWRQLIAEGDTATVEKPVAAAIPNVPTAAEVPPSQDFAPYVEINSIAVKTPELIVLGKKLQNAVAGATRDKGFWHINLDANQASGYITIAETKNPQDLGHISAHLSRLFIPPTAAADVSDLIEGKNTTAQIPSLDIIADNFELFGKKWGYLALNASNTVASTANSKIKEWRINKLFIKNEDAEMEGTGQWSNRTGEGISSLNYVLQITDAGKFLDRSGFPHTLHAGHGKLEGQIRWNGLPFAFDFPSLAGDVTMEMNKGRFLKADPGAGKLLGVLSLQSLPRRLTLDFRDVFSDGFAFDSVKANAQIQNGVLHTDNFKMNSVNATVLMDGKVDLDKETQDLHVAVIPEINAGTASVVYALAVNPVVGLGTFLAQLFLREPLARAFTFEYQVTGPWDKPNIDKIENKDAKTSAEKSSNPPVSTQKK